MQTKTYILIFFLIVSMLLIVMNLFHSLVIYNMSDTDTWYYNNWIPESDQIPTNTFYKKKFLNIVHNFILHTYLFLMFLNGFLGAKNTYMLLLNAITFES